MEAAEVALGEAAAKARCAVKALDEHAAGLLRWFEHPAHSSPRRSRWAFCRHEGSELEPSAGWVETVVVPRLRSSSSTAADSLDRTTSYSSSALSVCGDFSDLEVEECDLREKLSEGHVGQDFKREGGSGDRAAPRSWREVLRARREASGLGSAESWLEQGAGEDVDWLEPLRAVEESCRRSRRAFRDASFPPEEGLFAGDSSPSRTGGGSRPRRCRVEGWYRPRDISRHDGRVLWDGRGFGLTLCGGERESVWVLFQSEPCAEDVVQGELGDCWFLSSLAAVADVRGGALVRALLPGQGSPSAVGAYLVRLCLGGRWRCLLVDDRLPCVGGKGYHTQLAFCVTRRAQLWASVVEKALAKACRCYDALCGGESGDALSLLTGCPCDIVRLQEGADLGEVWNALRAAREAGFLLTCSTIGAKSPSLLPNHVYSLLDVCELRRPGGPPVRLMRIRNPNTRCKWDGAWSDRSPLWTPELRQQAGGLPPRPGSFFMALEDFVEHFAHFTVCRLRGPHWHDVRCELQLPGDGKVPCYGLPVQVAGMPAECSLGLLQPEERVRGGPLFPDLDQALACIGFALVSQDAEPGDQLTLAEGPDDAVAGHDGASTGSRAATAVGGLRCHSSSWSDCFLPAHGRYLLVPLALQAAGKPDFLAGVACLSSAMVRVGRPRALEPVEVQRAWAAYARNCDEQPEDFHGALLYMGKAEGGSLVSLVENHGEGFFGVELCVESDTLRFSRGGGFTSDWLPPGYGQILQVALPNESSGGSAGWASSHRFLMTSNEPRDAWHSPPVGQGAAAQDSAALHEPFPLQRERCCCV